MVGRCRIELLPVTERLYRPRAGTTGFTYPVLRPHPGPPEGWEGLAPRRGNDPLLGVVFLVAQAGF